MEIIQINCDECNIYKYPDAKLINFNCDTIKNIIDSNYITHFYFCEHDKSRLKHLFNKEYIYYFSVTRPKYSHVINTKYLELYKRFVVRRKNSGALSFILDNHEDAQKEFSVEEFMNTIKKGTIIDLIGYNLLQTLEKELFEHKVNFKLVKLKDSSSYIYMIDEPQNYTKPALKSKQTDE